MGSSVVAGKSQIMIVNGTRQAVWVAMYKRSPLRPNEPPIAWQVVSPPPRGKTAIFIPRDYQIFARYSLEPNDARQAVCQTNGLQVPHRPAGAGFLIERVSSQDRHAWGAVLTRTAESPGWHEIRVVNRFLIGVWCHVRQDGRDIFSPRILLSMAVLTEDLSSSWYVAVLSLRRTAGDLLTGTEIVLTEIAVSAGESVRIQGGPFKGFRLFSIMGQDSVSATEPDARLDVFQGSLGSLWNLASSPSTP